MSAPQTWIDVAGMTIATLPAVIAAVSSLLNGREQRRVRHELAKVNGKISGPNYGGPSKGKPVRQQRPTKKAKPDWFTPPKF